jgi:plasmid stability protein
MATVTIRNLPEEVRRRLRRRAARAGRSMEAEMRLILAEASVAEDRQASADGLREWVDELYGERKPTGVVDDLLAERRREAASE